MKLSEKEIKISLPIIGVLILITFLGAMNWRENRVVNKIIVKGNKTISNEEILRLAGVKTGQSFVDLNLSEIRSRIERHKFIKCADVYTNFPDFLFIEVVEREPVAIITYRDKIYYIDHDGFVLPFEAVNKVFPVPLLSGINYKPVNVFSDSIGQIKKQFDLLMIAIKSGVYDLISEIRVKGDEFIVLTSDGAVPVFLGNDEFEGKFLALKSFWKQYASNGDLPAYIDLRYDGKLYANFNLKN